MKQCYDCMPLQPLICSSSAPKSPCVFYFCAGRMQTPRDSLKLLLVYYDVTQNHANSIVSKLTSPFANIQVILHFEAADWCVDHYISTWGIEKVRRRFQLCEKEEVASHRLLPFNFIIASSDLFLLGDGRHKLILVSSSVPPWIRWGWVGHELPMMHFKVAREASRADPMQPI
jgi:hypothetical protein